MAVQVKFLKFGETAPEGEIVVRLPRNADGSSGESVRFDEVLRAILDPANQGRDWIYVEQPPHA
jgi:hypothetical protein